MSDLKFLRKDTFFFMRDEPPDVKRYLPQWLNKDPLFDNIQSALNIEHENYRLALAELASQLYVETTSDFQRWEQLLRIAPAADASDELRRATIRVKRRGASVMTVERTKELLADFAPRGEVDIREIGGNKLELLIHDGTFWWDELMQALMEQLPAHLTFDFEISRTINHPHYVGLISLLQGWYFHDQRRREKIIQPVRFVQGELTGGRQRFNIQGKNVLVRSRGTVSAGITELVHGRIRFECENEIPDEETVAYFERYLRRRWAEFNQNPVVEHYRHNNHGSDDEPVPPIDVDDDEEIILDRDFLRLYWQFPYVTRRGDFRIHLRATTILDPRQDVTSGEIKSLGQIGQAGEIFIWGKDRIATTGIIKAMYVRKKEMKII